LGETSNDPEHQTTLPVDQLGRQWIKQAPCRYGQVSKRQIVTVERAKGLDLQAEEQALKAGLSF